jgi:DNA polymerase III epsilon subunit-like protein
MILLGIDLETTGLDLECCEVIEAGAVLWDTVVTQPIKIYSTVLKPKSSISPEITNLTGISNEMVERFGTPWETVLKTLQKLQEECDYLVGHNAKNFDAQCLAYHGMSFTKL